MNLDIQFMAETFIDVLHGIPVTFQMVIVTLVVSAPLGFLMAVSRLGDGRIGRRAVAAYVSFIRGTPVVLQILFLYSLLPTLLNYLIKEVCGLPFNIFTVDPILYAYVVFILNTTAALPNICNTTVNLLKSTSLAFMMTVKDVTAIAKIDASFGYNYLEAYLVIFFLYILLCSLVQGVFYLAERGTAAYKKPALVKRTGQVYS